MGKTDEGETLWQQNCGRRSSAKWLHSNVLVNAANFVNTLRVQGCIRRAFFAFSKDVIMSVGLHSRKVYRRLDALGWLSLPPVGRRLDDAQMWLGRGDE